MGCSLGYFHNISTSGRLHHTSVFLRVLVSHTVNLGDRAVPAELSQKHFSKALQSHEGSSNQ